MILRKLFFWHDIIINSTIVSIVCVTSCLERLLRYIAVQLYLFVQSDSNNICAQFRKFFSGKNANYSTLRI